MPFFNRPAQKNGRAVLRRGQPNTLHFSRPSPSSPGLANAYNSTIISKIYFVGCKVPGAGVHWRIFLQIGTNPAQSVRVDFKPTRPIGLGPNSCWAGRVEMDIVDYSYSRNYSAGVEDVFIKPMTPDGFSRMLLHYNLADYLYAPGPRGCRYWCGVVIQYLEQLGFVRPGVFAKFERDYIPALNAQGQHWYPVPLIMGRFGSLYVHISCSRPLPWLLVMRFLLLISLQKKSQTGRYREVHGVPVIKPSLSNHDSCQRFVFVPITPYSQRSCNGVCSPYRRMYFLASS